MNIKTNLVNDISWKELNVKSNLPESVKKLEEIARLSLNKGIGILVNVSRSVLFAGHGENFDKKAGEVARHYQQQMENLLRDRSLI